MIIRKADIDDPIILKELHDQAVLERGYEDARKQKVETRWLDASLTKVSFYQALGWDYVTLATDGSIDSVR